MATVAIESMIAAWVVFGGILGLLQVRGLSADVLDKLLVSWMALIFQVSYIVSGILILVGIGKKPQKVSGKPFSGVAFEAAGIVLLIASLLARQFALIWFADQSPLIGISGVAQSLAFNAIGIIGFGVRLRQILRGDTIIRITVIDGVETRIE